MQASGLIPGTPELYVEGELYRSSTFPIIAGSPTRSLLPDIDSDDKTPLADLLRNNITKHAESSKSNFWSLQLLRHILSRARVSQELKSYPGNASIYLDRIRPDTDPNPASDTPTYLKIFALLVLHECGPQISKFVEEEVSDQNLPLCYHSNKSQVYLCRKENPDIALTCFMGWLPSGRDSFATYQWKVLVPYLVLDANKEVQHYDLDNETILPWLKPKEAIPEAYGGYAEVSCVEIDPLSHGFSAVLRSITLDTSLFAVKMLHYKDFNDKPKFENEAAQLRRFSGLVHNHLVTLLATYVLNSRFCFIFPYAAYDLDNYWKVKEPKPDPNVVTARWVAKQCAGILAAVRTIHDPRHLKTSDERRFGRHGDINPENILWFRSPQDTRGILVITDMGLTSFNRETSRSNIPNEKLPVTPGYRPPECDIKGGTISRAFDVWTLGCLFLELFTWLVEGCELLDEFNTFRTTPYITGSNNNMFFEHKKLKDKNILRKFLHNQQDVRVIQVKERVTEWFVKLHNHRLCTRFVHDALDIVEEKMLIVLSTERKRASAAELEIEFEKLSTRCAEEAYCMETVPSVRVFKAAIAVEVKLDDTAEQAINDNPTELY